MCKSWCEAILGIIILIFAFWQTDYSTWIVAIAALVLIWHSFMCKKCFAKHEMPMKMAKKKK
ncbi:MAG: hypothetical protein AABY16_00490 [Nanoarchaeota archaeon]